MNPRDTDIAEYNYPLPDERIAKHPLADRAACKLLVRQADGSLVDTRFDKLPDLLDRDTMLVSNNTRVIRARLQMSKPSGASIEIMCLSPDVPIDYALNLSSTDGCSWICMVGNSKKWKEGALTMPVKISDDKTVILSALRLENRGVESVIRFEWNDSDVSFSEIINAAGIIPIPPYLNRDTEESDNADYQTVYSKIDGSVAAPTAGLHFTNEILEEIDRKGIIREEVTLHVGAGTFRPVKADNIGGHDMHSEVIIVDAGFVDRLAEWQGKVVAVGTTSVRTLESLYHIGCMIAQGEWTGELPQWYPYSESHPALSVPEALDALSKYLKANDMDRLVASTRIIITPGYEYKIVDGMVTNFHQPQSTLLLLVSAFIGEQWREVYRYALQADYRFLSYGDACLFFR